MARSLFPSRPALLVKLAHLKNQSAAPVIVPNEEQARAVSHRIQEDLRSEDPVFVRQILLGMISEVFADRTGKYVVAKISHYHIPPDKKKALSETVSMFLPPVGAPIHRHSIFVTGIIPPSGRPKKKPVT